MATVLCSCGNIHPKREPCGKCFRGRARQHDKTTKQRGYGHDWRQMSERIREEEPLCVDCLEKGKIWPADECHHKVKIRDAPQLRLHRDNVMPLCKACHQARTEKGE